MRFIATLGIVGAVAFGAGACDDDQSNNDPGTEVDSTIADQPGVPFDPAVPDGVETDTNELENQGFDSDEPGPVGNVSEVPSD